MLLRVDMNIPSVTRVIDECPSGLWSGLYNVRGWKRTRVPKRCQEEDVPHTAKIARGEWLHQYLSDMFESNSRNGYVSFFVANNPLDSDEPVTTDRMRDLMVLDMTDRVLRGQIGDRDSVDSLRGVGVTTEQLTTGFGRDSRLPYLMKPDAVVHHMDIGHLIAEWKTSKYIEPWHGIQAAAYLSGQRSTSDPSGQPKYCTPADYVVVLYFNPCDPRESVIKVVSVDDPVTRILEGFWSSALEYWWQKNPDGVTD